MGAAVRARCGPVGRAVRAERRAAVLMADICPCGPGHECRRAHSSTPKPTVREWSAIEADMKAIAEEAAGAGYKVRVLVEFFRRFEYEP